MKIIFETKQNLRHGFGYKIDAETNKENECRE